MNEYLIVVVCLPNKNRWGETGATGSNIIAKGLPYSSGAWIALSKWVIKSFSVTLTDTLIGT